MRRNKIAKLCQHCQKEHFVCPAVLNRGRGKFCSKRCYSLALRTEGIDTKVCAKCNIEKPKEEFRKRKCIAYDEYVCMSYCHACLAVRQAVRNVRVRSRWLYSKSAAIKRGGVEWWDISEKDYSYLLSKPCHYCHGPLNKMGRGLDRKNNSVGYLLSNVVPCCKSCNTMKSDYLSYEEMMLLSPILQTIRKKRLELTA